MDSAFTELEESFFAEGDAMYPEGTCSPAGSLASAVPDEIPPDLSGIPDEIIDPDSVTRPYERATEIASYYASLAIESDMVSGFFEAAA